MARALAALIWILTIVIAGLFIIAVTGHYSWAPWRFPQLISEYGEIDRQFIRTLWITGTAFVLSHVALGYCILRYRSNNGKSEAAVYSHGNTTFEIVWTALIAVVFVGLGLIGQRIWFKLHLTAPPADAIKIEVVGQQFAWVFRYPGPDQKFGQTDPKKIDDQDNPLGLVPDDPDGKDDIVSRGKIVVPINRPVQLILRSKDVTHSFFVPGLRFKQDAVPGMKISVHFTATKVGTYELACAELCGLGHYKMRGVFEVMENADYEKWLSSFK